jgi:hypothetical protein
MMVGYDRIYINSSKTLVECSYRGFIRKRIAIRTPE